MDIQLDGNWDPGWVSTNLGNSGPYRVVTNDAEDPDVQVRPVGFSAPTARDIEAAAPERDQIVDITAMFEVAPREWWRFVPCVTCNAPRNRPCEMGGESFGIPARRPHASRVASARVLHGTLWLLAHHPEDVLGTPGEDR